MPLSGNQCKIKISSLVIIMLTILFPFSSPAQSPAYDVLMDYNSGTPVRYSGDISAQGGTTNVLIPKTYIQKKKEFRAVWVATIGNIDFQPSANAAEFKSQFIKMADNIKNAGFNAIIFQVRPNNDAFYFSKLNPWSKFLTGTEGKSLDGGFDPLKFMIAESHKRGIEFHAWLNPYRVIKNTPLSKNEFLKTLAPDNFAKKNPSLLLVHKSENGQNSIMLNPGEPAAMKFIIDTISEIIANYDVDAIHMDDYFYPYEGSSNGDAMSYKKYNRQNLSLDDWRRNNVDTLIAAISKTIRTSNQAKRRNVRFGISPFGIWANQSSHPAGSLSSGSQSLFLQHADTRRWVKEGWIDYIIPQLYWSFSHSKAPYAALADWWADTVKGSKTDLYIGHGVYQMGSRAEWKNPNEIANQLKFNCRRPEIKGSAFFSYRSIFEPENSTMKTGMKIVIDNMWKKKQPQN